MLCKHFEALSPAYDTVNAAIYVVTTICDLKIVLSLNEQRIQLQYCHIFCYSCNSLLVIK